MFLPNGERAVVSIEKLRSYCLNTEHPEGRHKARVFAASLGFTANNAEKLRELLLDAAQSQEVERGAQDEYGQRYILDVVVVGSVGLVTVRSSWIIRLDEEVPALHVLCALVVQWVLWTGASDNMML